MSFLSGHSAVLVNARGNIDRFRAIGSFRLDYEYEIEYEYDFRISFQTSDVSGALVLHVGFR